LIRYIIKWLIGYIVDCLPALLLRQTDLPVCSLSEGEINLVY